MSAATATLEAEWWLMLPGACNRLSNCSARALDTLDGQGPSHKIVDKMWANECHNRLTKHYEVAIQNNKHIDGGSLNIT
jgi:hypothetical protein